MVTKKSKGLATRPLWIITRYWHNRMKILTIDSEGGGEFLPVFSFEEEGKTFLHHFEEQKKVKWCTRQATAGELISVLMAPCANAKRVVLDPLPFSCSFGRAALPFLSVSRERFIRELMTGRYWRRGAVEEELVVLA
jgi:hypothetical protein